MAEAKRVSGSFRGDWRIVLFGIFLIEAGIALRLIGKG